MPLVYMNQVFKMLNTSLMEQVKEIKEMLSNGTKQCQIANEFSVDASVISDIKRGVMWRHVT